jgi:hypothetical protein
MQMASRREARRPKCGVWLELRMRCGGLERFLRDAQTPHSATPTLEKVSVFAQKGTCTAQSRGASLGLSELLSCSSSHAKLLTPWQHDGWYWGVLRHLFLTSFAKSVSKPTETDGWRGRAGCCRSKPHQSAMKRLSTSVEGRVPLFKASRCNSKQSQQSPLSGLRVSPST